MLSGTWTKYEVLWTEVQQNGYGTPVAFDPHTIRGAQFEFGGGQTFDIWVDDISFIPN